MNESENSDRTLDIRLPPLEGSIGRESGKSLSVFGGKGLKATLVTDPHGLKPPGPITLIESSKFNGCFDREVFAELILADFNLRDGVVDSDE